MKYKVFFFGNCQLKTIGDFSIDTFNPYKYFENSKWPFYDFLVWGVNGYDHKRAMTYSAYGVDRLYREKNPAYMKMVTDFVDMFKDHDLIVMSSFNFIHPEILSTQLKKTIKILGFVDDPHSTYLRGIPYLWAFDGAFFISPSFMNDMSFSENLNKWGCTQSYFWPLVSKKMNKPNDADDFFRKRKIDISYIGNPSGTKVDRLLIYKKHFGDRIVINGRWPLNGYFGFARGFLGKKFYPHVVKSLSEQDKDNLYFNLKIGLNMHLSDLPYETGNMRMYEVPAHGALLLSDKSAKNLHETIFNTSEAVYYDTPNHAIEIAEYYLNNDEERIKIAKNGFNKFWNTYEYENNFKKFLEWAISLKIT